MLGPAKKKGKKDRDSPLNPVPLTRGEISKLAMHLMRMEATKRTLRQKMKAAKEAKTSSEDATCDVELRKLWVLDKVANKARTSGDQKGPRTLDEAFPGDAFAKLAKVRRGLRKRERELERKRKKDRGMCVTIDCIPEPQPEATLDRSIARPIGPLVRRR